MQHRITGVSATALTVAAARAIATADPAVEFADPFARRFVLASGHAELPVEISGATPDARPFWEGISGYLAARSRSFDAALLEAAGQGVRQVVLLAAGLDARAYRLDWPAGVRLFELDREPVLAFKDGVLREAGAAARAERIPLHSDVAHDWPTALREAGFDPGLPTAWLVEGLLPYLPAALETSLVTRIDDLSAPGSRLVLEFIQRPRDTSVLSPAGTQIAALFDTGPRPDTLGLLSARGWSIRSEAADDRTSWSFAHKG